MILQNLTHRGTVLADGFLFSAKLLPEKEMRRRALLLWQTDARLFRVGNSLVLLFSQSFRVDCLRAAGLPLVRYDEILASFPLGKNDLEFFEKSGESLVLFDEGSIRQLKISDLQPQNAADWFDVSNFQIVETETLGEVKTKPVVIEKIEDLDLREKLAEVPPADSQLAAILQTLKAKKAQFSEQKSGYQNSVYGKSSAGIGAAVGAVAGGLFGALASIGGLFGSLFSSSGSGGGSIFQNSTGGGFGQSSNYERPQSSKTLKKWFSKMLFHLKISQLIGREQAKYLMKMMEMFENGDLEEALKHAIPLEDMQALKEMSEQMPFLGFLRPRDGLEINYGRQNPSGSSVFVEDQWFSDLRALYRQTFDRLVAQNRIEEAAFVLVELLKSNLEAVEFLEKHKKYRLAAELAESRDLAKEVIVRQWFLAGEKKRAVQIAVLHECFEYVVAKLEQQKHPQAADLRQIWAENLANGGNYAAAVKTIWQLEERREIAKGWIEKAIAFGGAPSAEMLAKKIVLMPESFDDVKNDLLEIIGESDDLGEEKRAAFAREAVRLVPNDGLRILARPLARKLLADISKGSSRFAPNELHRLVELSQDYALRADLPKLPQNAAKIDEIFKLEIREFDKGAAPVFDACLLPDGKIAVALGEAGVKIFSKQGKTIAHFDQPTFKFAVSDSGTKAVCLARRGEVYRLAKIDFVERKAVYWCDAKIEIYAPSFDGNSWFIAGIDEIYAIDTNAKDFEAVWRVPDIGGRICEIARSKTKLMLLIKNQKGFEKWWYDLPQFALRSRNDQTWFQMEKENQFLQSVSSFIAYTVVQITETVEESQKFEAKIYDYNAKVATISFAAETKAAAPPKIIERVFVLVSRNADDILVELYDVPNNKLAEIRLKNTEHCFYRLDEKYLTVTDNFGRVIFFDHKEKLLRKNLRV